ncbi:uncharacterized protein LOC135388110 isoform X2 [Ornithodoros turicata]|uniref:uncharacterized protein LOC135388110 isoform X2 n=1 Tax=Ornithodoros turicata TaxID=34597 RepID=UPI003139B644
MYVKRSAFNKILIHEVRNRPSIWNPKCSQYRNLVKKNNDWSDIAYILNAPENEIQTRWKNLRDTYARKLKVERKRKEEGGAASLEPYAERWIHFKQLSFLSNIHQPPSAYIENQHPDPDASSSSLMLSGVCSLAEPSTSETSAVPPIEIKEEIVDEVMEDDCTQHIPSSHSPAFVEFQVSPTTHVTQAIVSDPTMFHGTPAPNITVTENPMIHPISPPPQESPLPSLDVIQHTVQQSEQLSTDPSAADTPAESAPSEVFKGKKRMMLSWNHSLSERKSKMELDILQAERKKVEADHRRSEADERKLVTETLLMTEKMQKVEEEKKKLRLESEFLTQEKKRSEEKLRKMEAVRDFYVEERRKSAAAADYYVEEKKKAAAKASWFVEQRKTEVLRQRLLLLEIRKLKRDLKEAK